MKKILSTEVFFEIEINEWEDIYEKGWEYVHKHLPQCFDVECGELTVYDDEEEK